MVLAYLCELDTIYPPTWLKLTTFICAVQIDAAVTKLWPQFPDSLSPGDKRVWLARLRFGIIAIIYYWTAYHLSPDDNNVSDYKVM